MSLSKDNNEFKQTSATEDSLKLWQQELITDSDAAKAAKPIHLSNSFKINKDSADNKQTRNDGRERPSAKASKAADSKDLDYREALRRSLDIGAKKSQNANAAISSKDGRDSDQHILSAESSEHESESFHKPEYLMSPLNEDYEDFEEFNSKLQKCSAKIIDEYNNMHQEQFEFIQQFSNEIRNNMNDSANSEISDKNKAE